jgi:hypothetical protein
LGEKSLKLPCLDHFLYFPMAFSTVLLKKLHPCSMFFHFKLSKHNLLFQIFAIYLPTHILFLNRNDFLQLPIAFSIILSKQIHLGIMLFFHCGLCKQNLLFKAQQPSLNVQLRMTYYISNHDITPPHVLNLKHITVV